MRCAIKIAWLCQDYDREKFNIYLSDGLKSDVYFKNIIKTNIDNRHGLILPIEERILHSIDNCIAAAGLSEVEIQNAKKMPNMREIIRKIGASELEYSVLQKMGSHSIHGSWTDLLTHYLEKENGNFQLRDANCPTNYNYLAVSPLIVIRAIAAYLSFLVKDDEYLEDCNSVLKSVDELIREVLSLHSNALHS